MQQPHFMIYITYTVHEYIYMNIHKYLPCTTNFEKGGREPKRLEDED